MEIIRLIHIAKIGLLKTIMFVLLASNLNAQNISESEIRNNGISKITSYYKSIPFDSSTEQNLNIIKSSRIMSIRTFDELGRNIESTYFLYSDSIVTTQKYNYTDSILVSISQDTSNNCTLSSNICFKQGRNFKRSIAMKCEENYSNNIDKMRNNRNLNQNVILFSSTETSLITNYEYDPKSKIIKLWSPNNFFQLQGEYVWIYNNSFQLIKMLSFDYQGNENSPKLFYPFLSNCNNTAVTNRIKPKNISYSNNKNLQIQNFTKLMLKGQNRSNVLTYEYEYK